MAVIDPPADPKIPNIPAPKRPPGKESGFVLVVSLALLASLLLIGVSLSTMASIELRKANNKKALTSARVNARLAATKGFELLQFTTGPDQRVTAPAGIWKEPGSNEHDIEGTEQYWTGVHHSQKRTWNHENKEWVTEGRTQNQFNGENKIDDTLKTGLDKQVWLVSGHDMKDKDGKYLNPKSVRSTKESVVIHEGAAHGVPDNGDVRVLGVDVPFPDEDGLHRGLYQSRYAFWASDEGTKTKVNIDLSPELQYPNKSSGSAGLARDRLPLMSPRTSPMTYLTKNGSPREPKERMDAAKKIASVEMLKSTTTVREDVLSHHFTTKSMGVLADVARGGLKKDLSRGLGDQFKAKLAGEVMWSVPLPERKGDGEIQDLDSYQSKRDKNVNKRAPEQHRGFLRGPLWDIAHSWYSLYLPKPPFMMGFYGGVEDEFHPTRKKNQSQDLVGRSDDATIYKYSENTVNRGPKSNVNHATSPNLEPRSPAGAQANNWIFRNSAQTTKYFTNKPIWQHSNKDGENFKIDFTKNGYPRGSNYWRNENVRHSIAPVLIEYTFEIGMMAVDATYLWDLTHDGQGNFYPYKCARDGYVFYDTAWRDQPGNRPPFDDDDEEEGGANGTGTRTPMPVCALCNKQDQVEFTGGYRETGRIDPRFGDKIWDPNQTRINNVLHLDRTKFRREVVLELIKRGLSADGTPGLNGLLAHRTPKFRQWMFKEHPTVADKYYNKQDNTVNIAKYKDEFFSQFPYLDIEKHSRGLRDGNEIEQNAYKMMLSMFKPILIFKPTLVYWNPYNVQLNNVRPFIHTSPGNAYTRWVNGQIHLPDASINTSSGPLQFYFANNKRPTEVTDFTWMSLIRTPYVDRYTNNFNTWYGFSVPNNPAKPPFYKHDFRPGGRPDHAFNHERSRLTYRMDIDRFSTDQSKIAAYNFAPGEIKVFTPKFTRRAAFNGWHYHNMNFSPEGEDGFAYSLPLNSRFLDGGEMIRDITLYNYPAGAYEYVNGSNDEWRHRFAWELETAVQSNRDTIKQKHNNPEYMHVGRLDRLVPDVTSATVTVQVGKSMDSLYPRGFRWEDYKWWDKRDGKNNWHKDYGGIRGSSPQVDGTRGGDGYGGPKEDNDFMNNLAQAVSGQIQNHLFFGYNFRRKAADSNPSESMASWAHLNARAHDVLRNGEKDGSPFGWEGRILSRKDLMQEVLSVSSGIAKWGSSFTHKGQSRLAMVDVPRQPMHSIVELTHADLGQFNLSPTFPVGNSYASPFVPPDQAYATKGKYNLYPADVHNFTQENNTRSITKFFNAFNHTLPDFSYQLNKCLFDRYFFSTIPDWPYNAQGTDYKNPQFVSRNFPPFDDFDQDFVDKYYDPGTAVPAAHLPPNPRIRYYSTDGTPPRIGDLHDMDSAAANLLVDGAFNVNSTSVQAWAALLKTLKGAEFKHTMGIHKKSTTAFLRSIYPYWGSNDIWQGFTEFSDDEIEVLAEAIVEEVRNRGPFLSMANFINRSLVSPKDVPENPDPNAPPFTPWKSGALQSALDKTVNREKVRDNKYGDLAAYEPKAGSHWLPSAGDGSKSVNTNYFIENAGEMPTAAGIPGWTMQSDILRPLAPILNARSDTFTIRGYGEVKTKGIVKAKATCELLVQRVPEYVNNEAHSLGAEFLVHNKEQETWYNPDPGFEPGNRDRNLLVRESKPGLMENFQLGRRYKILQFRWL
jgi:hypothetical protein